MPTFQLKGTLAPEEVLQIHEILVRDFANTKDPISPPGVRSMDLLASAVSRQHTGIAGTLKYPDAVGNASTMLYGLCNDHPFHNGNKRTALVSMLVHLDKNRLALDGASQSDLYQLMLDVAAHTIVKDGKKRPVHEPDQEVAAISKWLTKRVRERKVGERQVTYRQFKRLLERHGYTLYEPQKNSIKVGKYVTKRVGLFRKREVTELQSIWTIGYPGEGREVGMGVIRDVRRRCHLTTDDGVDSTSFYDEEAVVDAFIARYSKTLTRLARN